MANPWTERIARAKKFKAKRLGLRAILQKRFGGNKIVQANTFKASQLSVFRKFFR